MTALENVAAPLELAGAADANERARAELEQVGLGGRLSHYPVQLSGGEQQRVALARALCPRPSLLIADEPTGNLDEATGRAIIDMMFDLPARRGATLALVTHDASLASRCDRVIRMRSGRIEELPQSPSPYERSRRMASSARRVPIWRFALRDLRGASTACASFSSASRSASRPLSEWRVSRKRSTTAWGGKDA